MEAFYLEMTRAVMTTNMTVGQWMKGEQKLIVAPTGEELVNLFSRGSAHATVEVQALLSQWLDAYSTLENARRADPPGGGDPGALAFARMETLMRSLHTQVTNDLGLGKPGVTDGEAQL
jgi:hypothetical protein